MTIASPRAGELRVEFKVTKALLYSIDYKKLRYSMLCQSQRNQRLPGTECPIGLSPDFTPSARMIRDFTAAPQGFLTGLTISRLCKVAWR